MKIQDALKQNLEYWNEQLEFTLGQKQKLQAEADRYQTLAVEAQEQINLWNKAQDLLKTLEPAQVDQVNVVDEKATP